MLYNLQTKWNNGYTFRVGLKIRAVIFIMMIFFVPEWLPDAIENKCEGCSEKQKLGAEKVMKFLIQNHSDIWKQLEEKYDPQEVYRQRYTELLDNLKN